MYIISTIYTKEIEYNNQKNTRFYDENLIPLNKKLPNRKCDQAKKMWHIPYM